MKISGNHYHALLLREQLSKFPPQESKPLVLLILNGGDHTQSSFAEKRNGYVFAPVPRWIGAAGRSGKTHDQTSG